MTRLLLALLVIGPLFGQLQHPPLAPPPGTEHDTKLPNGKSQREEIVKEDYRRNLEDAAQLAKLSEEVKADLEKDDSHIVSIRMIKKLDEVEKLAKAIRNRLKRY